MYCDGFGYWLMFYVLWEVKVVFVGVVFCFICEGVLNVFYWVDGFFGYVLLGVVDWVDLEWVFSEVYW